MILDVCLRMGMAGGIGGDRTPPTARLGPGGRAPSPAAVAFAERRRACCLTSAWPASFCGTLASVACSPSPGSSARSTPTRTSSSASTSRTAGLARPPALTCSASTSTLAMSMPSALPAGLRIVQPSSTTEFARSASLCFSLFGAPPWAGRTRAKTGLGACGPCDAVELCRPTTACVGASGGSR